MYAVAKNNPSSEPTICMMGSEKEEIAYTSATISSL